MSPLLYNTRIFKVDLMYESLGDSKLTKLVLTPKRGTLSIWPSSSNITIILSQMDPLMTSQACMWKYAFFLSCLHAPQLPFTKPPNIRVNTSGEEGDNLQASRNPIIISFVQKWFVANYGTETLVSSNPSITKWLPSFSDTLTLLQINGVIVKAHRRVRGFEGTGPWWTSVFTLLLCGEGGKDPLELVKGKGLSSYQLFKAALEFLGMSP